VLIDAPGWWFAWVVAAAAPLALRNRAPFPVIAWTLFLLLVTDAFGSGPTESVLPLPLIVVAAYTAGRRAPDGRTAAVLAIVIGATLAAIPAEGENTLAEDIVAIVVIVGGATGAGHVMRVRDREHRRLEGLTEQLAAEREAHAQAAVLEERARVARELHDIVAHSVSLIAVQASAADELLGRDEERARASLRAVQDTARGALGEMRRLLAILRTDEDDPGLAPQPGVGAVGDLVAQARDGGLPIELHQRGEARPLAPGVDLSGYRIVQEALTNVRKHAGGARTEVVVGYAGDELVIEVANEHASNGAGTREGGGGHGLAGMRERVRIYGGTLEAGPEDRRFVVRARLPASGAAP
jgi:signal transduction histidine kinase